ncbi:MAG TPA: DinB family protein [Symbiobacteriaceae bacterium]|nr:DinB family protein [Symbiobacteriaceae bacterium]
MLAFDVYRHWETDLRPITLAALRKLTPEQLVWKPEGWAHSAWDLAVHMADCEWIWLYRNALKKEPWETRWDPNQFANLGELIEFWSKIHRTTVEWLQDTPVSHLNRKYPMPYVEYPYATMNWLIYHVMEHEIHHRGQLFMLMRMQGVQPPEI